MGYVDCMMAAVPTENRDAYIKHAKLFAAIAKENGALRAVDCWEVDVPDGEVTSMPMAVKRAEGEAVAVGWIEWPSKAVRDAAWEKMMQDPRMDPNNAPMPFDGKRLVFGGFDVIQDA